MEHPSPACLLLCFPNFYDNMQICISEVGGIFTSETVAMHLSETPQSLCRIWRERPGPRVNQQADGHVRWESEGDRVQEAGAAGRCSAGAGGPAGWGLGVRDKSSESTRAAGVWTAPPHFSPQTQQLPGQEVPLPDALPGLLIPSSGLQGPPWLAHPKACDDRNRVCHLG